MKSPEGDLEVKSMLESLQEDDTWPGIDYEDVSREDFLHTVHLSNMVSMARAYQTKIQAGILKPLWFNLFDKSKPSHPMALIFRYTCLVFLLNL